MICIVFLGISHYERSHFIVKVLLLLQIISFLVGKSVSINDLSHVCYRYYTYDFPCSHEPCSDIIIVIDWLLAIFISWGSHNERTPIVQFYNEVDVLWFTPIHRIVSQKKSSTLVMEWNSICLSCINGFYRITYLL